MHVLKEATQSSKIEGTQTNMEEAYLSCWNNAWKQGMTGKKFRTNVKAMNSPLINPNAFALFISIDTRDPSCIDARCARWKNTWWNFLSVRTMELVSTINDAVFVPPVHFHTRINEWLGEFAHAGSHSIAWNTGKRHWFIINLKPFTLSGWQLGRVGRVNDYLYLVNKGILKNQFYISDFLSATVCYTMITRCACAIHDDITQWLCSLTGVIERPRTVLYIRCHSKASKEDTDESIQQLGKCASNAQK